MFDKQCTRKKFDEISSAKQLEFFLDNVNRVSFIGENKKVC